MTHVHQPKGDDITPKLPTTGSGVKPPRHAVTVVVPAGYKDAGEFLQDCGFEPERPLSLREQFERIITTLNYDDDDADSLTVGEIRRALPDASGGRP